MEIKVVQETCCAEGCGIAFWIEQEYRDRLISTKRSFYCPNGHSMSYQGESDKAKAKRLAEEKRILELNSQSKDREIERLQKALKRKRRRSVKK